MKSVTHNTYFTIFFVTATFTSKNFYKTANKSIELFDIAVFQSKALYQSDFFMFVFDNEYVS